MSIADDNTRRAVDEILQGRTHAAAAFNLTTGVTSTVVTRTGVSSNSVILTQAYSALASNADITRIVPAKDSFTVTHTNSGNARTHRYVFLTGLAT
jgi:hypothetical protein